MASISTLGPESRWISHDNLQHDSSLLAVLSVSTHIYIYSKKPPSSFKFFTNLSQLNKLLSNLQIKLTACFLIRTNRNHPPHSRSSPIEFQSLQVLKPDQPSLLPDLVCKLPKWYHSATPNPHQIQRHRTLNIMPPMQTQASRDAVNNFVPHIELRQAGPNGKKSCAHCAQLKVKCLAPNRGACPKCMQDRIPCEVQTPLNTNRAATGLCAGYVHNLDVANRSKDEIIIELLTKMGGDPFDCWQVIPAEAGRPDAQPYRRINYNKLCQALNVEHTFENWEPTSWLYDYRSDQPLPLAQATQSLPSAVSQAQSNQTLPIQSDPSYRPASDKQMQNDQPAPFNLEQNNQSAPVNEVHNDQFASDILMQFDQDVANQFGNMINFEPISFTEEQPLLSSPVQNTATTPTQREQTDPLPTQQQLSGHPSCNITNAFALTTTFAPEELPLPTAAGPTRNQYPISLGPQTTNSRVQKRQQPGRQQRNSPAAPAPSTHPIQERATTPAFSLDQIAQYFSDQSSEGVSPLSFSGSTMAASSFNTTPESTNDNVGSDYVNQWSAANQGVDVMMDLGNENDFFSFEGLDDENLFGKGS